MNDLLKTNQIIQIILVCLILLFGCVYPNSTQSISQLQLSPASTIIRQPVLTIKPSPQVSPASTPLPLNQTALPQFAPTEVTPVGTSPFPVRTRYNLNATFSYTQHWLTVSETISYTNYAQDELNNLILVVEPNLWKDGFSLISLTLGDGMVIENYELNNDQMSVLLPQPLQPQEEVSLKIDYQLKLPEIGVPSGSELPLPFGYSERQTNIVDWYPYIPPYHSSKGWLVHPNWQFGEHQVFDEADFTVEITLAEPVKNLVVAASAPAEMDENRYSYHLEAARTFALSASDEYILQSTNVGNVTIYSYAFPYHKSAGLEVLQNTADALKLYSDLIMPYPHSSLTVVEADFLDGMEYDGLYFLSYGFYNLFDGTQKGYLTIIAVHETAHQWWYGLVGNDQALEPWLDEALCTYMEHIYYENVHFNSPPRSGESLVDWWWSYRVNFYHPSGWVDSTIYDFNQYFPYRDAVYLNGAKFLDDLRNLMGEADFFAFLKDYAIHNAHGIATSADFFAILRNHTSQNLDGLLSAYFHSDK